MREVYEAEARISQEPLANSGDAPAEPEPEAGELEPGAGDPIPADFEVIDPVPLEARPRFVVRFRPWIFDGEPPDAARAPGLYWLGTKGRGENVEPVEYRVAGPIACPALTRTEDREAFGRLLRFRDHDGRERQIAVPCSAVAGDGLDLIKLLLDAGLDVVPRQGSRLVEFIGTRAPAERVIHVTRTGWITDASAFVLPAGPVGRRDVVFQRSRALGDEAPRVVGEFGRWRETIGAWAVGNWRLGFLISTALSGPLYYLLGLSPGGFHFWGQSSTGKSASTGAAASVWGLGDKPFVRGWSGTNVGIEGAAILSNDLPLFLDEIKEAKAQDFDSLMYFLINGRGKLRGTKDGSLRRVETWRALIVSNGEYELARHIRMAGAIVPAGLKARIADVNVEGGRFKMFDDIHGFADGDSFAKALEEAGKRYYGHAGPAFVEVVLERRGELKQMFAATLARFEAASGLERRVGERFAAAALAGELATDAAILPWERGFALEAALAAFERWRDGTTGADAQEMEDHEIVEAIRGFLETQRGRFQTTGGPVPHNRAGFVETDPNTGRETFRIFKAALADAPRLQTWSASRIAAALDRADLLAERDADGNRRWKKVRVDGRQERVLVVALPPAEARDA